MGPNEILECIHVVDAQPGHGTGGSLPWVGPPAPGFHGETAVRGDIPFDLNHPAQGVGLDQGFQRPVGRLPSAAVPDREDHPGAPAGVGGPASVGHGEGEGLLDEDVLPGLGRSDDLLRVERVGCREKNALHLRVLQHGLVAVRLAAPVLLRKRSPLLRRAGGARHQGEVRAFGMASANSPLHHPIPTAATRIGSAIAPPALLRSGRIFRIAAGEACHLLV